jgi:hypothetical protein
LEKYVLLLRLTDCHYTYLYFLPAEREFIMIKFRFSKQVFFILTVAAICLGSSVSGAYNSLASEVGGQKISVAGLEAPDARKAEFEKRYPEARDIPLMPMMPKKPEMRTAAVSGDDGYINRDFIIPVMHKTSAPEEYIEIRNQSDLYDMRYNLNGKFILMNDVTMEGIWTPVGESSAPFTGTFDGNGYVIRNMQSEISNSMAGLFGRTLEAEIMNLGMENSSIEDNNFAMMSCGGIAAELQLSVIDNCYNKSDTGRYYDPESGIDFPYTMDMGGIAGSVAGGTIKNCYNTGDVFNSDWAGGIAGYVYFGTIENCYNEGAVYGIGYAGGIAAKLTGTIKKCYNLGDIYGASGAAGGITAYNANIGDIIDNCYNSGTVSITENNVPVCGGIIGAIADGSVLRSYNSNSDTVNGIFASANYYYNEQGDTYSHVSIVDCYYPESLYYDIDNIEFFQYLDIRNLTALSDDEMKQKEFFAGFNFEDVWDIDEGIGTPFLRYFSEYIYFTGFVTDFLTSEPISDASMIFRIWGENSDDPFEFRISTDENGEYGAWILPGITNIRVNKSGYISFDNGTGEEFTEDTDYNITLKREKEEENLSPLLVLSGNTVYEESNDDVTGIQKGSVGGVSIEIESYDNFGNAYVYITSSTTPADVSKNSRFQLYFYPGKIRITAYKEGYNSVHIQTLLDETTDDYEILMTPLLEQVYIEMQIKSIQPHYELAEGEEAAETDISNFGNLEFELIDKTQSDLELLPGKDFTVLGNTLVITRNSITYVDKEDNVLEIGNDIEGHTLEIHVRDISGKLGTASDSFTFTRDKENPVPALLLTFTEEGRWETSENLDGSFDVSIALLFGKDGGFIDRFVPEDGRFEGRQLPESEYTLVFIENYPSLQQVPDLNYFGDKGFIDGTDYISIPLEIKRGIISVADMTGKIVPELDHSKEYLNLNETSITLNRYKTPRQYSVDASIRFSIDKQHINAGTNAEISITLTENCSVYQNKIWIDGKECSYSESGGNIVITVPTENFEETVNGTVKFYIMADDYGDNTVNADLNFINTEGEEITCPIGTADFLSYEIEITNLPVRSTNNQYTVMGNAASGTWVSVYVDGVEMMPAVKANSAGNWKKTLTLFGEESGETVFNVKAAASSGISTQELELICDVSAPSVSSIKLGTRNHNNNFYGGISVKYDGAEWIDTKYSDKSVTQPFNYIRYVNPWFYGNMREKISFEVSFDELPVNARVRVAAYDGSGRIIAYVPMNYSPANELWEGSRDFSDGQLPKIISVLYTAAGSTAAESAGIESEKITLSPLIDPSGFVYEAVESNRVEDAEVVLWERKDNVTEEKWLAEDYNQINPFYTGADGNYMWDVPDGEYQVRVSKEDYEPAQSGWITVPPPQSNLSIGLRSNAMPEVAGADWVEDDFGQKYIAVTFSQYMNVETLQKSAGSVSMTINGSAAEDFDITFINGDNAAADDEINTDRFYAQTMELWVSDETGFPRNFENGDVIEITISGGVKNYRDKTLGEDRTKTIIIDDPKSQILKVTAPAFEMVDAGYAQPEAKAITIENTGNRPVTISSVTVSSDEAFIIGGSGETVEADTTLETWTIQPKTGLEEGVYNAVIEVAYSDVNGSYTETADVSFEVAPPPYEIVTDDEGNSYVAGLKSGFGGMTASALTEIVADKSWDIIGIFGEDGTEITGNIGTGMKLRIIDENGNTVEYTLAVKYDVTGAGRVGLSDIFTVVDYSVSNATFDTAQKLAIGDVEENSEKLTGLDLIFDMIDYAVGNQ